MFIATGSRPTLTMPSTNPFELTGKSKLSREFSYFSYGFELRAASSVNMATFGGPVGSGLYLLCVTFVPLTTSL